MGRYVLFKCVTDAELERAEQDSDLAHALIDRECVDNAEHTLWPYDGLQFLLDAEGLGITVGWPETPDQLMVVVLTDGETIFGLDSETVYATATDLSDTPFDCLSLHFDKTAMAQDALNPTDWSDWDTDEALDYLQEAYDDLVTFLTAAAEAGAAVLMKMP